MDLGLADAGVCVQGGSKGMGRAAARCFARDGARVVILARDPRGIDETCAELSAHSTKRQTATLAAYTASKAAMTGISKNMSLALGVDEILVNTVSPGSFASDGFKAGMRMLAPDRDLDPDNFYDCMQWIREASDIPPTCRGPATPTRSAWSSPSSARGSTRT